MSAPFVYGVLDVRDRVADRDLADRCRELTFAWSRWSYPGAIVEHADPHALVALAAERGARHVFVQASGHLVVETLRPKDAQAPELVQLLIGALGDDDWLVGRRDGEHAIGDDCWLVDVERWHARGRPRLTRDANAPRIVVDASHGVAAFPDAALALGRNLAPERDAHADALRGEPDAVQGDALAPEVAAFVASIARTLDRSQRGVFVWNLEGYDDLDFAEPEPLAALYTVAAGFKPDAILRACGHRDDARIVFMDYSDSALAFRRDLVEHWNGRDLPAFLWPRLAPGDVHYWLRSTVHGGAPSRDELDTLWARELADWGGADAFAEHWARTRRLDHRYVRVDLMHAPEAAAATMTHEPTAVWWSNAFSSVYALWHWRYAERAQAYARWIEAIARHCPDALLIGADIDNTAVAGNRAGAYAARLAAWRGGMHEPLRASAATLRF